MTTLKFRKRAVVVEAVQWTGGNETELIAFTGDQFQVVNPEDRGDDPEQTAAILDVLHNTWIRVYDGQWIIKGISGEFYPITEAVLAATYETADNVPALTFHEVSAVNTKRANRWHPKFPDHEDGWTGADWSNAAGGEGGEMLDALQALLLANGAAAHLGLAGNVVKKLRRLDTHLQQAEQGEEKDETYAEMLKQKLATEIGDTFIYLDLLATFYGLSMERCVVDTFNRVSEREGFPEKIDG